LTFEWPLALLALLVVPVLVGLYVRRERRRTEFAARFANPALLPNLVPRTVGRRRHVPLALLLLALSTMLVGVARPRATVSVPREEATIVVAIDVSTSMTSKDVEPTRLVAARRAARAFVADVPEKFRIGLVSFAGRAIPVVPPTVDRTAFENGLAVLRPAEGTALGDAIRLSVDLARRSGERSDQPPPAAVVVVSDGAQTVGRVQAATAARRARVLRTPVYTIVLGTPNGTIERTLVGGYKEITRVPANPQALESVARVSGGSFFTAADSGDLKQVYEKLGSQLGTREEEREITDYFSAGAALFLLVGAVLSTAWFRRAP
jgi:Ca-activated chloride channel family protein